MPKSRRPRVCLEVGPKKAFASALDWPGWCRAGKTEVAALEALATYAPRYTRVAERAGIGFVSTIGESLEVVERVMGGAGTDFGFPGEVADAETQPVTLAAARRQAALVTAAWVVFDEVSASSPAELRKGPRGGGRDRDKLIGHVLDAEAAYARKLGIKHKPPAIDDVPAIEELREAIAAVLATRSGGAPIVDNGWPSSYAARRIAWHVLDHAWEMEDRGAPSSRS